MVPPSCAMVHTGGQPLPPTYAVVQRGGVLVLPRGATADTEHNASLRVVLCCTTEGNRAWHHVKWSIGETTRRSALCYGAQGGSLSLNPVLWCTWEGNQCLPPVLWCIGKRNLSLGLVLCCTREENLSLRPVLCCTGEGN